MSHAWAEQGRYRWMRARNIHHETRDHQVRYLRHHPRRAICLTVRVDYDQADHALPARRGAAFLLTGLSGDVGNTRERGATLTMLVTAVTWFTPAPRRRKVVHTCNTNELQRVE